MTKRRVVVTGLGIVSPLGSQIEPFWQSIISGESGVSKINNFDTSDFLVKICAHAKGFDPNPHIEPKDVRKMDLFTQYGIVAASSALQDSALELGKINLKRIGVAVGSGIGGITTITNSHETLLRAGPKKVSPFFIPSGIANMLAGQISIYYGLKGPNISIVTACSTGSHNIGIASRMIQYGDADIMVAGGSEMATTPLCIAGFTACRALSKRNDEPTKASRPWDRDRDGFVLGEGSGILILEEYEHAMARGAKIYGELIGFGMSSDAYHITLPDEQGEGAYMAMKNALEDAQLNIDQIDYINAHGTSTPAGDEVEILAIKRLFKDHVNKLAVSSTKSMIGHLLGAAGAVEAVVTLLSTRDDIAPPTINLDNPSPGCDLNLVPHQAQKKSIQYALTNSFGFGATNACLIFKKY